MNHFIVRLLPPLESTTYIVPTVTSASTTAMTVVDASRRALLAFPPISHDIKPATPYPSSFSVASMGLVDQVAGVGDSTTRLANSDGG